MSRSERAKAELSFPQKQFGTALLASLLLMFWLFSRQKEWDHGWSWPFGRSVVSDDYKIASIVGVADCVDKEKSNLTYFDDGDIKLIKKLVLDYSKIPSNLKIFRLINDRTLPLVHQSIKDAIVGSGMTGCVFYRPEEFH